MEVLTGTLGALTGPLGLPGEALPVALVRPLSGSGAFGLMTEVIHTHGPDSYVGTLVSVLNGCTETTFYVMAVYFGSVGVTRARHAIAAGLTADLVGVVAATLVVRAFFGHLLDLPG
jgi:spore maturation protein B